MNNTRPPSMGGYSPVNRLHQPHGPFGDGPGPDAGRLFPNVILRINRRPYYRVLVE
jgi:hypothetical protein